MDTTNTTSTTSMDMDTDTDTDTHMDTDTDTDTDMPQRRPARLSPRPLLSWRHQCHAHSVVWRRWAVPPTPPQ